MGRKGSRGNRGEPGPHGKRSVWGHQVKRGNRESKEFRVPEGFPVQKENPENPFHFPP